MENKFIILMMSCNRPLYIREEQACRDTFLKDAEGAGIPYWFYKGGDELVIDPESNEMRLPVPDGLGGTARKTVAALTEALKDEGWDYLVKTNVSTWLDVGRIQRAVENWDGRADTNVYGARFLVNQYSKNVPFPRGNFTIFSRSVVEGIVKYSPMLLGADGYPKTDDTLICLSSLYYVEKKAGKRYLGGLMEVPSVFSWSDDIVEAPEWTDALCVRCKDERNPENTPENMRRVHELKATEQDRTYRRPVLHIETPYGFMDYERYCKIVKALKDKNED